jgi:hypothetical protein
MACNCPVATALTTITATGCPEEIGQIQRAWFVRKGEVVWDTATAGAANVPVAIVGDLVTVIAGWNTLKIAADSTKVVFAPLFGGDITIAPAEAITQGGNDNSTLNGQTYFVAFPDSTFSARYDQLTATQTGEMKELVCEDLEVYFINEDGDIIGDASTTGTFKGFDCSNVALGSRNVQGFATRDSNIMTFQLDADWDTIFEKQTPTDFNALTGI